MRSTRGPRAAAGTSYGVAPCDAVFWETALPPSLSIFSSRNAARKMKKNSVNSKFLRYRPSSRPLLSTLCSCAVHNNTVSLQGFDSQ